jgi:D-psicose/D-tagatose/L-ribulose 3-epimerase
MKFGINTLLWGARIGEAYFARLPAIREAGFHGIEVPIFDPTEFPAADLRRCVESAGLECTAVSIIPAGLGLGSDDGSARRGAEAHVRAVIDRAAEAGIRLLSGPLYFPVGYLPGRRRTENEWARTRAGSAWRWTRPRRRSPSVSSRSTGLKRIS